MINHVEAVITKKNETECVTVIAVGSTNPLKIRAVKESVDNADTDVIGCSASSNVRSQPLSEEETREGAITRAKDCLNKTNAELGIGLEAGVFFLDDDVYLCHFGALVDRNNNIYLTNGPMILLPREFRNDLLAGHTLEEIMHHSTGIENLGSKNGAVGIFTKNRLNREQVLKDIAKVLLAQYHYYSAFTLPNF